MLEVHLDGVDLGDVNVKEFGLKDNDYLIKIEEKFEQSHRRI